MYWSLQTSWCSQTSQNPTHDKSSSVKMHEIFSTQNLIWLFSTPFRKHSHLPKIPNSPHNREGLYIFKSDDFQLPLHEEKRKQNQSIGEGLYTAAQTPLLSEDCVVEPGTAVCHVCTDVQAFDEAFMNMRGAVNESLRGWPSVWWGNYESMRGRPTKASMCRCGRLRSALDLG